MVSFPSLCKSLGCVLLAQILFCFCDQVSKIKSYTTNTPCPNLHTHTHTHTHTHPYSPPSLGPKMLSRSVMFHSLQSHGLYIAHQSPLSMEISRQEYWSEQSFPSPEDLSKPGIEPRFPALQADSLPSDLTGSLGVYWSVLILFDCKEFILHY